MPIAFFITDTGDLYADREASFIAMDDETVNWLKRNKIEIARKKDFVVSKETPLFGTVIEAEQWLKNNWFPNSQFGGDKGTPAKNGTFEISLLRESFIGQSISLEKLDECGWQRESTRLDGTLEGPGEPWVHTITFLSQKEDSPDRPEFEEYIIIGIEHLDSKITDILCAAFAEPDVPEMGVFEPPFLFGADYDKAREVITGVLAQVLKH